MQHMLPREQSWSHKEFKEMVTCINKFIELGAINKCIKTKNQFVSQVFLVKKPDGSNRMILNLKRLNSFIDTVHFKMENFKCVMKIVSPGCYMASVDLKDAYLLVPINKRYRKYLRFQFNSTLYEFQALPFGLSTAPFVFTKIMKPVVAHLRSLGWLSVVYLDDFLLFGSSREACHKNVEYTVSFLESLGFVINKKKSRFTPSQSRKFLGFVIDSEEMNISLPHEKRLALTNRVRNILNMSSCKIQIFAEMLGSLVAACPAVEYGWSYTKPLEREKYLALSASKGCYNSRMVLKSTIQPILKWWLHNLKCGSLRIKDSSFALEIFSDASGKGWGIFCGDQNSQGLWSPDESHLHINIFELLAAFFGLKCFAKTASNCQILLRIDNTTAIAYINRMGGIRFPKLAQLAREIWRWCEDRHIWIFASI